LYKDFWSFRGYPCKTELKGVSCYVRYRKLSNSGKEKKFYDFVILLLSDIVAGGFLAKADFSLGVIWHF